MNVIIPEPMFYKETPGSKKLERTSRIFIDEALCEIRPLFAEAFPQLSKCRELKRPDKADIAFVLDKELKEEAYKIAIDINGVMISASGFAGALYALKSLEQMAFTGKNNPDGFFVSCAVIEDEPRYKHRGLMLDESRHFFGKDEVKRLLNVMAFYKLNTFHWHLTDDQGWRIEIKKYPLLTEIGSKRKDSQTGGWHSMKLEGKPHSGFYTQEDIKEIVEYAEKLNIAIVPEIDMPAHFAAAIASYSNLACRDIKSEVHWFFGGDIPNRSGWFDYNRPCCPGKDTTIDFIYDILDEVTALFPAPLFHIGGDEAPKKEWKKCPECQKRIRENGLNDAEELQGWLNNLVVDYLKKKGKRLVVWNEALKAANLDMSVVGQYWTPKNDSNVLKHIEKGGDVIISKHQAFYFDMSHNQYPLENTYNFEVTDSMVPKELESKVLGLEGELWTEWVSTREKIDLQLFPRLLALSECCWKKEKTKDFGEFLDRKSYHEKILDEMGIDYAVDEVSMPKNPVKRKWEKQLWMSKDTDREVYKNRYYKNK